MSADISALDGAAGQARTPHHPRFAVGVLAFCGVVVAVMQTIVVPLLPHIPALTGATPTAASWLVTVTLLTGAVFTPVLGRVGDMYGKRRVLVASLAVLVMGSVLCAVSSHIGVLITGRALQGAALAVVPLGISILRDELPPERVLSAVALMSSTLGIGAAVGLPVAALVVENFDWHTMFWVSGAIGVIDIVLVLCCVPESPLRTRGRFDGVGALGLSAALVCLLLAVTQGADWGWTSTRTVGLLVAAVVVALLWGAYELRVPTPMVDLRVSARPAGPAHQRRRPADRIRLLRELTGHRADGAGTEGDGLRARRLARRQRAVPAAGRCGDGGALAGVGADLGDVRARRSAWRWRRGSSPSVTRCAISPATACG